MIFRREVAGRDSRAFSALYDESMADRAAMLADGWQWVCNSFVIDRDPSTGNTLKSRFEMLPPDNPLPDVTEAK